MREIKFRAWDKVDEIMDGPFTLKELITLEFPGEWLNHNEEFIKENDIIFLENTGLKDVSGKEIYEGDLVKINNYKTTWKHSEPRFDWRIFLIEWNKCTFAFRNSAIYMPLSDYDLHTLESYELEIIGNIYEDQEILNATNSK